MKRITSVEAPGDHRLKLKFSDGVEGIVDLSAAAGKGMFAAGADAAHFGSVKPAHNGRALEWPGEIDLCADALYLEITGMKPEVLFPKLRTESVHA